LSCGHICASRPSYIDLATDGSPPTSVLIG
jgi:hypothetical protein